MQVVTVEATWASEGNKRVHIITPVVAGMWWTLQHQWWQACGGHHNTSGGRHVVDITTPVVAGMWWTSQHQWWQACGGHYNISVGRHAVDKEETLLRKNVYIPGVLCSPIIKSVNIPVVDKQEEKGLSHTCHELLLLPCSIAAAAALDTTTFNRLQFTKW